MKIQIDITPEEFKELFLPGEKQQEFMTKMFEAYSIEMQKNFMASMVDWPNIWKSSLDKFAK